MKLCCGFQKPLLFILALISSCANSYGMETACVIPAIVFGIGGLCCFNKRQCSPTPTRSHQLPQPLHMTSIVITGRSTEIDFESPDSIFKDNAESPDSIFKSVLERKNSNPKVLDIVDMGTELSHK